MRTMLLQGVFVGGELEGARKQWPCVLKSTHPLTERLEIPPFGGRPLFVESLDSEIDRTKMPRSAFEFEPGTAADAAREKTTKLPPHRLDL